MKYIITDHNKFACGNCLHPDLRNAISGKVVSAGQFRIENGKVKVWGSSSWYGLSSREEDAKFIETELF